MAKLSTSKRKSLTGSQFGLPEKRKYPMQDESHARNAKARAEQQVEKGHLSEGEKHEIDQKADRIIARD